MAGMIVFSFSCNRILKAGGAHVHAWTMKHLVRRGALIFGLNKIDLCVSLLSKVDSFDACFNQLNLVLADPALMSEPMFKQV